MSFGSTTRFEVKDGGKGGIFWQKEKPKQKQRKQFGYKSKELRHAIRRPEPEYIEEAPAQKPSKDFIKRNREQYRKPRADENDKENHHHLRSDSSATAISARPSSSSSAIKPGTVTLTQDQLNALLATVGKVKPGDAGNIRISIDAEHNALQVETPRDSAPEEDVSIFAMAKNNKTDDPKASGSSGYSSEDKAGAGKGVRFDSARNQERQRTPEPTPAPPSTIPWRHMTVAERKRVQWAREREAEEQLQKQARTVPWGRPGDGAPQKQPEPQPQPVPDPQTKTDPQTRTRTDAQTKTDLQEELSHNEKIRRAIEAIEAKYGNLLNEPAEGDSDSRKASRGGREKDSLDSDVMVIPGLDSSYAIPASSKEESSKSRGQGGKRMEDKGNTRPPRRPDRRDPRKEREAERKEKKKAAEKEREEVKRRGRGGGGQRREEAEEERRGGGGDGWRREQEDGGGPSSTTPAAAPAAMQSSLFMGQSEPDTSQFLSKKELEKKKWLEELDRQREEKRLQKQREKEKDREGIDDTWADRFVSQSSQPQYQQQQQQPASYAAAGVPSGAWERNVPQSQMSGTESSTLPPAAMRTAMSIGNVAPNIDRIQQQQAEEKRLWLEELNKQREEQREARQRLKDQRKAESPDDTWATRFTQPATDTTSHRAPASRAFDPSTASGVAAGFGAGGFGGGGGGQFQDLSLSGRVSSAPQPPMNELLEDESKTHLRGQNVHMDPVTKRELEDKRRKHLEYQAAIKLQIEEKEKQKREEREQKWREEIEGEKKLQAERDALQRQLDTENNKSRQREEARQKQLEQLKTIMDAEQERAQEERMKKRLTTLQQAGHDISSLKAHYEAITPRIQQTSLDPASVPGLMQSPRDAQGGGSHTPYVPGLNSYRQQDGVGSLQASQELGYSGGVGEGQFQHGPYTENRVLTPTRFRGPGQHNASSSSWSPHREFATQTGGDLLNGLRREPSEVEIEYKGPFQRNTTTKTTGAAKEGRGVRTKSGDRRRPADNARGKPPPSKQTRQKQQKAGDKPSTWNYQNKERKAPIKQSEKDPFYEQRKQESEERRAKRERQLQYLAELNKQVIPTERSNQAKHHHRVDHSDLPAEEGFGDGVGGGHGGHSVGGRGTVTTNGDFSHRSHSPPVNRTGGKYRPSHRGQSPPVPAARRKAGPTSQEPDHHNHHHDPEPHNMRGEGRGRGRDDVSTTPLFDERGRIQAPTTDTDFVPFTRTIDILDPSRADEPVQLSRENTRIKMARQNYHENLKPATYGNQLNMYRDSERQPTYAGNSNRAKDPIMNPGLVKDHPTARQDQILQQLSSLKQSLIQRRREIETCMSPSDLDQ